MVRNLKLEKVVCILVGLLWLSLLVGAQEPIVTVTMFSGHVNITLQGQTPVAVKVNDILRAGDTITTLTGAQAVLKLSEGSELHVGPRTTLDIAVLLQRQNGARVSKIKLLNGQVRSFLVPNHQKKGSAFTIETPNATVGVKFSQPDIEVIYNSETQTTYVYPYTTDVIVRNLLTKEVKRVQAGGQAIIQARILGISRAPVNNKRTLLLQTTVTEITAAILEPGTSTNPTVEGRTNNPEVAYQPRRIILRIGNE